LKLYKNSSGNDKAKWKKEAIHTLKKKKFYEEYINKLNKRLYDLEMKNIQFDIDKAKEEFVRINLLRMKFPRISMRT
jgi:hypothetical protein